MDEIVQREVKNNARNQAALDLKVEGKSFKEIGRIFEVSDHTAKKWVDKARQDQRLRIGQGIVSERLVPQALAVYEQRLQAGDLEAARDILFGSGILLKNQKVTIQAGDPLQAFRDKYFGGDVVDQPALPSGEETERMTDHDS